jgi:hypothetical protein
MWKKLKWVLNWGGGRDWIHVNTLVTSSPIKGMGFMEFPCYLSYCILLKKDVTSETGIYISGQVLQFETCRAFDYVDTVS